MDEGRAFQIVAVMITFLVTSFVTVCLRCYTMGFILKRFFIEDYLAVVALVR